MAGIANAAASIAAPTHRRGNGVEPSAGWSHDSDQDANDDKGLLNYDRLTAAMG